MSPAARRGERRVRLRSAETGRLRSYDVDADLDDAVLQRVNDIAFLFGVEVVSTCAGHRPSSEDLDDRTRAQVRFAVFYLHDYPLDAQRAGLAATTIASALQGRATRVELIHMAHDERDKYDLGRWWVFARHARPTTGAEDAAAQWWRSIADRLERAGDALRRQVESAKVEVGS